MVNFIPDGISSKFGIVGRMEQAFEQAGKSMLLPSLLKKFR